MQRMKVEFIVGRSGSGKTTRCYEQIENHLKDQSFESLMLLVPEQFNLQTQRDLAKRLAPGLLRAEVMSFNILAREVFREVGKEKTTVVEDLERMIILKRVIEANKKDIVFYKKNVNNTGFIESINRFITVMEQAGIEEAHLSEMKQEEGVSLLFESKLTDIELIYHAFKEYLGAQFVTVEKNMTLLATSIAKSKKLEETYLWIDGFYGFTYNQLLIISELMKKVKGITITLPMDYPYKKTDKVRLSHPFYESVQMLQKLMGMCEKQGVRYEVKYLSMKEAAQNESKAKELVFLEENYLRYHQKPYENENDAVYLTTYGSRYEEVEAAARRMAYLVREEGYRYHDMAVMVGDLGAYKTIIEGVFKEYELPYFLDMNRNIHTNGLVAVIEALLEVMTTSYSYKSMMTLLRTYMLPVPKEEIDVLENYILAYGIKGKKKWLQEWQFDKNEEKQEAVSKIKEKVLEPILAFEENLSKIKAKEGYKVVDLTKALYGFLEKIEAYASLQKLVEKNSERGERAQELENSQMWGKVMEVFERLVDILGEERLSLLTYRRVLETSFSYIKMGMIPPARDQILVGSMDRTRLPRLKACFILGTNEGLIPKVEDTGTIFSDMDKVTLSQLCQKERGPKARLGDLMIYAPIYGVSFEIYTVLTRATSKLFVSAAMADDNGKLLRPSSVYFKLKRLFKEQPAISETEEILKHYERPQPAFGYVGGKLRGFIEGREEEESWKDAMSFFATEDEWKGKLSHLKDYLFYTNQQHQLKKETSELLYGKSLTTNISQLESFRQCACCYFIRYGLKAEERKLFSFDRAKVGTLFHAALEQYPKALERMGTDWVKATPSEQQMGVKQATEYALEKVSSAQKETGYFKFTASKVEKMTMRAVRALTSHLNNGDFTPEGYEISFGEGYGFPAIEIDIDEERKLLITGTIDRVDVFYKNEQEHYVKILDYKSGQKNFNLLEVYYGLQLQLLLYLDAYLEKHPESQAGGVFYFHITNPYVNYKVGMADREIEDATLKQFKLSGMALEDLEVIRALDKSGTGTTIPVGINKDGSIKKNSSVATRQQFAELEKHIIDTIKHLGEEILSGKISTKPYLLNGKSPCDYCAYHTVCQFNEEMPDNCYENLEKLSKDQIWEAIEKEGK